MWGVQGVGFHQISHLMSSASPHDSARCKTKTFKKHSLIPSIYQDSKFEFRFPEIPPLASLATTIYHANRKVPYLIWNINMGTLITAYEVQEMGREGEQPHSRGCCGWQLHVSGTGRRTFIVQFFSVGLSPLRSCLAATHRPKGPGEEVEVGSGGGSSSEKG